MGEVVRFPQRVPAAAGPPLRPAFTDPAALLAMPLWGTGSWSEELAHMEAHHVALFGRVIAMRDSAQNVSDVPPLGERPL